VNIVFLGPPGSGKGTQARLLVKEFNWAYFSLGDILRRLAKEETDLGKKIKRTLEKGKLVDDQLVAKILKDFLKEEASCGIIFDGFPRTLSQAKLLAKAINSYGKIDLAIYLQVGDKEVRRRLGARLVCPHCGAVYNLLTCPPKKKGVCDFCGHRLEKRSDETLTAINSRLKLFHQRTRPVIDYFKDKGVLVTVDGERPIGVIYQEIKKIILRLGAYKPRQ